MITLKALDGVRHGFFTREGGVSEGIFASLNCGFGSSDEADRVAENRARVAESLGVTADRLATCHQIHSAEAVIVESVWRREDNPRADGMATRTPGVALGILTADCAPVLFCDPASGTIGAAHAGWRGAVTGILEATVAAMERLGARRDRIRAGVGPCIGQESYEVGPEFPAPFLAEDEANGAFFAPGQREGRFQFDLAGYVAKRLNLLGIAAVESANRDTAAEAQSFYSYRRMCLVGEADYGRQISAIALPL